MNLTEALYFALSGGRDLSAESVPTAIAELKREHGSRSAAARAVHVSESTLRRWESGGTRPKPATEQRLIAAYRASLLGDRQPTNRSLVITVEHRGREQGRQRDLTNSNFDLAPGTMARVTGAYLAGDMARAVDIFIRGIREDFYANWLDDRPKERAGPNSWRWNPVSDSDGFVIISARA